MSRSVTVTCSAWRDRSLGAPEKQTGRWCLSLTNMHIIFSVLIDGTGEKKHRELWIQSVKASWKGFSQWGRGTNRAVMCNNRTQWARGGRWMMFSSQEAAFVINSPPQLNDRHGCCTSLTLLQDSNTTEDANDRNVHVCFSLGFSGFLSCQVVPPTVQTEQV